MIVPAHFYLALAAILFFLGVFGFFTRRNLISLLISTELMLNAVDINFAVFNAYCHWCGRSRNSRCHSHYHQCIPQRQVDTYKEYEGT